MAIAKVEQYNGAPIDRYFHDDMANPAMPDYKLYIFVNCIYLSTEER